MQALLGRIECAFLHQQWRPGSRFSRLARSRSAALPRWRPCRPSAFLARLRPHRWSTMSVCTATVGRRLPGAGTDSAGMPPTGGRPARGAPARGLGGGRWRLIHSRSLPVSGGPAGGGGGGQPRDLIRSRCLHSQLSTRSHCRRQRRLSTPSRCRRPPQRRRGRSVQKPPAPTRAQL